VITLLRSSGPFDGEDDSAPAEDDKSAGAAGVASDSGLDESNMLSPSSLKGLFIPLQL
jgi:hypothetical protein